MVTGLTEAEVFAHWKEAARRQAEEEAAALGESLTRTGDGGSGGGGNGSDGPPGGTSRPR